MDLTKELDDRNSFLHWFLICALTDTAITDEMRSYPREVVLTLNGTEINPLRAINRLKEEFDRMVENRAREIIGDYHVDISSIIYDALEDAKEKVDQHINDIKNNNINEE